MTAEQNLPFLHRFWIYQKERFPLLLNTISVTVFTFSAVSYSRICRGEAGFIETKHFVIGAFAVFTLFLLVRIFDEHKDRVEDAKYRSYLPVPRGLIKLSELRNVGIIIAILQISMILIFQLPMIWLYLLVMVYLCLMGVEFFVPDYLKQRQMLYITSHMFIMPVLDLYSSGLDWLLDGDKPHLGLLYFCGVSYMNGMVLEFGRKMRIPETEEEGVVSYTKLYGLKGGPLYWIAFLLITYGLATLATNYAGYGLSGFLVLTALLVLCAIPGILFLINPEKKYTKWMEIASGLWTVSMYLTLGAIPMISAMI